MDIYDRFDKATGDFTAVALIHGGVAVGRIVVKYGAAATAFVQVWGAEMTTGRATGGGYDKTTAAIRSAADAMNGKTPPADADPTAWRVLLDTLGGRENEGCRWDSLLESAGFTLARVI